MKVKIEADTLNEAHEKAVELGKKEFNCEDFQLDIKIEEVETKRFLGLFKKTEFFAIIEKKIVEKEEKPKIEKNISEVDENIAIKNDAMFSDDEVVEKVIDFLTSVTKEMNLDLEFKPLVNSEEIIIKISGNESSAIIGRRGVTLDAFQYLSALIVNKNEKFNKKIILDVENYREKREEVLINLANKMAKRVEKQKRSLSLEPMNPYERQIIHSALQSNYKVYTKSHGEEPFRRVVIFPKR